MAYESRADYRVLAQGTQVFYRCERATAPEQRYLSGLAADISLGGVFVATSHPPPVDTVLRLHLYAPDDSDYLEPLAAKAIVKWRRAWGHGRGMGVQFVELEGAGSHHLESLLGQLRQHDAGIRPLGAPSAVA